MDIQPRPEDWPLVAHYDQEDARDVFRTAPDWHFDLVIHCAAVVGGRAVIDGVPLAQAVNLELDAGLFQWAERTKPGLVVYISSSAVYPVHLQQTARALAERACDIHDPWMPDQLYGWGKLTGEMLASRYSGRVMVIRPFSGYGEDQDEDYPFRAFAERAKRREDPFVIWGSGKQVRDFIHIADVVQATLVMADEGFPGPVNLGTGRATSMTDLARMMCHAVGYNPVMAVQHDKPEGVYWRVADTELMGQHYKPLITLEEGVQRAVSR
jgi:nucleoside-diphosphate-sugar epimerase